MNRERLVTIAIPTRDRPELLRRAVLSALAQTYPHVEVLVSDNASAKGTAAVLAELAHPRLRVVRRDALVPMMAHWDLCVAEARGELFLLLSDDDFLHPQAIEALEPRLSDGHGIAYCRADVVDARGEWLGTGAPAPASEPAQRTVLEFFGARRTPFACSVLLRTADVKRSGGYSGVPLQLLGDARIWMAAALGYPRVAFVDRPLCAYCTHPGSATTGARLETWMEENQRLAEWCAGLLRQRGEGSAADEVLRRVETLKARSAVFLIAAQVSAGRGRVEAARQMVALAPPRASAARLGLLAHGLLLMAMPVRVAALAAAVRRRLRRHGSGAAVPPPSVQSNLPVGRAVP